MLRFVLVFITFGVYSATGSPFRPDYPPTTGEVWPKPQHETKGKAILVFDSLKFTTKITNHNCTLLHDAVRRYVNQIKVKPEQNDLEQYEQSEDFDSLEELQLELTKPCEDLPYFEMDESYNLTVSTKSVITSASVWGMLRGLETFSQLFYTSDDAKTQIKATEIVDYPRYAYRGLMLDTSRHYLSVAVILKILDGMMMNKMNALHWHIVDDQSFPYQSEKFPELSKNGAFHQSMLYTKSDIQKIVKYATDRGIRVIPEFDMPGHSSSWGESHPELLTSCSDKSRIMNPINEDLYKFLAVLFKELQEWFPDKAFHFGGDEVPYGCWKENSEIKKYMDEHNMSSPSQLHDIFMKKTIPLLAKNTTGMVWEEVYSVQATLPKDYLVQVWKSGWLDTTAKILKDGYRVIFSEEWYLDQLNQDAAYFYLHDPRREITTYMKNDSLAHNIVGGEACMWGEKADDSNILTRIWPRASAAAEVMWSTTESSIPGEARCRLEEHTCRMRRRGVPAEPPYRTGFCVV